MLKGMDAVDALERNYFIELPIDVALGVRVVW
jgi:hypothetical protein